MVEDSVAYNSQTTGTFCHKHPAVGKKSYGPGLLQAPGEDYGPQMAFLSRVEVDVSFRQGRGVPLDWRRRVTGVQLMGRKCLLPQLRTTRQNHCRYNSSRESQRQTESCGSSHLIY